MAEDTSAQLARLAAGMKFEGDDTPIEPDDAVDIALAQMEELQGALERCGTARLEFASWVADILEIERPSIVDADWLERAVREHLAREEES